MKHNSIQLTFGPLPIFCCGALIVPVYAESNRFTALREMMGADADPLEHALARHPVAVVASNRVDANYDTLIGVRNGDFQHLEEALYLAENLGCRNIVLPAFGVYELTAEAVRIYARADRNLYQVWRAHRLYAQAAQAAPRAAAALADSQSPLQRFASQLGYVQLIDVVTAFSGCNEISAHFDALRQ